MANIKSNSGDAEELSPEIRYCVFGLVVPPKFQRILVPSGSRSPQRSKHKHC